MNEPTIFSHKRCATFEIPLSRAEAEERLKEFVKAIARPLLYDTVVLGHIKVVARIPGETDFLFLSLTSSDRVDIKTSPSWLSADARFISGMEIKINVLVFGYSMTTVTEVVEKSLKDLSHGEKAIG